MIKRYLKPSRKLGDKNIIMGGNRIEKKLVRRGNYKINKIALYKLNKKKMKHKRYYFMQIRRRFLKSMNIRNIRKILVNRYLKYSRFQVRSNKTKYFIFKKQQKKVILAKNFQNQFKMDLLRNYYKRMIGLFKIIDKLKKHANNTSYIYKYFKKLYKKMGNKLDRRYIYKYFRNIYMKSIKFIIFKYCKNKIANQ